MRGDVVDDAEYLIRHRGAPQGIWVITSARPVRNREGEIRGGVSVFRDVTAHKRAEEEIRAAYKELEAFAYTVSHDLRAPLRAIDGFVRILLEEYGQHIEGEARRYLGLVAGNAQQMGRLVDDLLRFSRLSRQPLQMRPVNTMDVVHRALEQLRASLDGRQVEISIGRLAPCQGDPNLLEQVFVNLIGNAIKYTQGRDPAQIEIGCQDAGTDGQPVYFVKDNGAGFDMQYVHKLFGVFQRLHRSDEYEGTGVGLAIVQRIVQRHGGRIWPQAEVNRGATFYFTVGGNAEWQAKAA
jgi:light-regulated signal transduction histidine kinase (bacteriophytochrome)